MDFTIPLDAASLAKLRKIGDWQPGTYYFVAMEDSLQWLQESAVNFMYANMINPQGPLEEAFTQTITPGINSIQGKLANPSAYAWRQNEGFSNMTDSLGRYFPWTPAYHFMDNALQAETPDILERFRRATQDSLTALGGP